MRNPAGALPPSPPTATVTPADVPGHLPPRPAAPAFTVRVITESFEAWLGRVVPAGLRTSLAGQPLLRLFWSCWKHAGDRRSRFVLFIVLSCLAQCALLAKPYFFGKSFDALQAGGPAIMHNMTTWLLLYFGMQLVFWSVHGPSRVMERFVAFGIRRNFFTYHYSHIRKLPYKWHQDHHPGDTINRVRKANDALFDFAQNIFGLVGCAFSLGGPILILFWLSWPIAVLALVVNGLTLFLLRWFDSRIMAWIARANETEHRFTRGLLDYLGNMTTVITLRLGRRTEQELNSRLHDMYRQFKPNVTLNEAKYFLLELTISALEVGIVLLYVWQQLSATGAVAIGTTVAIFRYLNILSGAYYNFAGIYQNVQRQYTDLKSLDPIRQAEITLAGPRPELPNGLSWHTLSIHNLNFYHQPVATNAPQTDTPAQPPAPLPANLSDINLTLQRGQRIALVGESGSGKSTLLALIRGLYSLPEGTPATLTVDGSLHTGLELLADLTTLIPQQPEIFDNTISYNITVGLEEDHVAEHIARAVYLARFENVLKRLPQGLNTDTRAKGVHLSGGEKQRLALARGLFAARESSLLLLDEPTSSVDSRNEADIYDLIFQAYPEKTIISSIHRLHLLDKFDHFVVMAGGRIVQQGPLTELLAVEPFRSLWQRAHG